MKKILICMILMGLFTMFFLLNSCSNVDPDVTGAGDSTEKNNYYAPTMLSLEEYESYLKKRKLPEDFVHYDDIALLGEFHAFSMYDDNYYQYSLRDGSNSLLLTISSRFETVETVETTITNEVSIPLSVKDLSSYQTDEFVHGNFYVGSLKYLFMHGKLASLYWYDETHRFTVSGLREYEMPEKETFLSRLLHRDTAEEAFTELQNAANKDPSTSIPDTEPVSPPDDVPCRFVLESEEHYRLLKQASTLSDDELPSFEHYEALLWLNPYSCHACDSAMKNNIDAVVSSIEKMAPVFPRIDSAQTQYAAMSIYPHEGRFELIYRLNDGLRYRITVCHPKQEPDTIVNGTVSLAPVYHSQKLEQYEFDLYAYHHMDGRDYLIGEYAVGEFRVKITLDAPKEGESLSLDQFYFVDSDPE